MCGFEVLIYPSVMVAADGFCAAPSPTANTSSSARGIRGLVKMNTVDLLINYMDLMALFSSQKNSLSLALVLSQ